MTTQTLGLVIGGLIPAVLFAFTNIFSKASTKAGIGIGTYMVIAGIAVTIVGLGFYFFYDKEGSNWTSASYAFCFGFSWAMGAGLIAIALTRYGAPISKLAPIFNTNTLLAVLLAMWIFSEWQGVKVPQLLIGTLFIVVGGTLVALA